MRTFPKATLVLASAALVCASFVTAAEAAPRCRAAVEGNAARLGALGVGSARAREAARAEWEDRARYRYGARYAKFWNADNVRWLCRPGFISPARCRVIANPCRG